MDALTVIVVGTVLVSLLLDLIVYKRVARRVAFLEIFLAETLPGMPGAIAGRRKYRYGQAVEHYFSYHIVRLSQILADQALKRGMFKDERAMYDAWLGDVFVAWDRGEMEDYEVYTYIDTLIKEYIDGAERKAA